MTAKRADPGAPREDQDEPQGGGGNTPNKSKKELDRELDKALQDRSRRPTRPPVLSRPNQSRLAILKSSPEPRELMEADHLRRGATMPTPDELKDKFWNALKSDMTMMIGLDGTEDGHARPMTAQLDGEAGPIWFFTAKDNALVQKIGQNDRAIATFTSKGHDVFATVHGRLSVDTNRAVIDRLWNRYVAAWYEGGKDDPKLGAPAARCRTCRDLARRLQPHRRHQDAARDRSEDRSQGQGRPSAARLAVPEPHSENRVGSAALDCRKQMIRAPTYPKPPFPRQKQRMPGLTSRMDPTPDHGEHSYKGAGRLKGRRAIITGGDSGIGRAVAIAYAREGANLLIAYLNEDEDAKATGYSTGPGGPPSTTDAASPHPGAETLARSPARAVLASMHLVIDEAQPHAVTPPGDHGVRVVAGPFCSGACHDLRRQSRADSAAWMKSNASSTTCWKSYWLLRPSAILRNCSSHLNCSTAIGTSTNIRMFGRR